ncbi:MAG: hypothetical protein HY718_14585, partial [Planctomycetes bacterium]|nr:hypothetical protein [Planctomycetota bacterium]
GQAGAPAGSWDDFAPGGFESELGAGWNGSDLDAGGDALAVGSDFAPTPDLRNKVDYVAWYEQNCLVPDDQNAYHSYAAMLDGVQNRPDGLLSDRYNDRTEYGPPEPWNPADYPTWEASYQATQGLIQQFREGSQDPRGYSSPVIFSDEWPESERTLIAYLLPSLAGFRAVTKATLSQAWRSEDGTVPPQQMRDALQTCLGNAVHLQGGATLIERLVSIAERSLTEENARWALHRGVFPSAGEIETTFNLLRERDTADPDPAGWVKSEHACAMDLTQYLFEPTEPGGQPQLRPDRLEKIIGMTITENDETKQKLRNLTAEDAKDAIQHYNTYYAKLDSLVKNSWPGALPENPDVLAEQINDKNALAGMILPSLNRAYELMRRTEAQRRATQVIYSVELFRARHGRYPGSLNELPYEEVQDLRTDPFSGQDFAYRVTDTGAMLYSVASDGRDDGGVHARTWEDGGKPADHVFWPPQPSR